MMFTGYASEVWLVHQLLSIVFDVVSNRQFMFSDDDSLRTPFIILTADEVEFLFADRQSRVPRIFSYPEIHLMLRHLSDPVKSATA